MSERGRHWDDAYRSKGVKVVSWYQPDEVTFTKEDILAWRPPRRFGLWHDRAVFHFLTDEEERMACPSTLTDSVRMHAGLVLTTFAKDGPEYCSGPSVVRYSRARLTECPGAAYKRYATRREVRVTPGGAEHPTWIAARRSGSAGRGGRES